MHSPTLRAGCKRGSQYNGEGAHRANQQHNNKTPRLIFSSEATAWTCAPNGLRESLSNIYYH